MKNSNSVILFNQKQVRRWYDEKKEIWYFSIIDIVEILTDSSIPKRYWSDLKSKLVNEGSEVYEKIVQLKFTAVDGKKYATDCFSIKARLEIEKQTSESVITNKSAKGLKEEQRIHPFKG